MAATRARAAAGSIAFFVLAPGANAVLVPWLITRWEGLAAPWAQLVGPAVVVVGTLLVVASFVPFVTEGRGTPAPDAPTEDLVVGGIYRWVRNPLYVGAAPAIAGRDVMFTSAGADVCV